MLRQGRCDHLVLLFSFSYTPFSSFYSSSYDYQRPAPPPHPFAVPPVHHYTSTTIDPPPVVAHAVARHFSSPPTESTHNFHRR
jgi:hypothetical protein